MDKKNYSSYFIIANLLSALNMYVAKYLKIANFVKGMLTGLTIVFFIYGLMNLPEKIRNG